MNATVKGPETLVKNNTFVRYADMNGHAAAAPVQGVAGLTQSFPRPAEERPFDRSLNEREPAGT